ncbi:hypothetical protein KIN20_001505 [Parelaphostrongylus tenuis]|uniref:Uncharacterized protein n=1 Tax=Parelaphostrongylus tenuis TaxID=148309 RepID=A0AAD5QCB5_PARTN|nr:hypothetical protein KIN20_001505 [Parelaphostrongylus tenuis]
MLLIGNCSAQHCYSCSGTCHSEPCNCQMGSCPSNQCFIEKKPTEDRGIFRITKGCLRKSPRTLPGCEYEHFFRSCAVCLSRSFLQ